MLPPDLATLPEFVSSSLSLLVRASTLGGVSIKGIVIGQIGDYTDMDGD